MNLFLIQYAHAMTKLTATMPDLTQPAMAPNKARKPNSARKGRWSSMAMVATATMALAVEAMSAHWPDRNPDGSLNWSGCTAVVGPADGAIVLRADSRPAPTTPVTVHPLGIEILGICSVGGRHSPGVRCNLLQTIGCPVGLAVAENSPGRGCDALPLVNSSVTAVRMVPVPTGDFCVARNTASEMGRFQ